MIAVGVTGHRLLPDSKAVSIAVDQVFRKIRSVYEGQHIQVISPLAEGADRIVARRGIEGYQARLIVPLPLEPADYMLDFESESSKNSFKLLLESAHQVVQLPPEPTREESYLAAGQYVLEHSDLLIAVWDGEPARGTGGTGQIAAEARQRGLPLAWIQVARSRPESPIPMDHISKAVHVIYERFPTQPEKDAFETNAF